MRKEAFYPAHLHLAPRVPSCLLFHRDVERVRHSQGHDTVTGFEKLKVTQGDRMDWGLRVGICTLRYVE